MIRKLRARWYLAVGAGLLAAAIAGPIVVWSAKGSDSSAVSLDGISIDELAAQGIFVTLLPGGSTAAIDSQAADRTADEYYPNVRAKQVVLAHLKTDSFGGHDTDIWIVNLDPRDPNLTPEGVGGTTKYAVVFVDANDGHVLFYGNVAYPPPGGWGSDMGPGPGSSVPPVDESSTPAQAGTPPPAQ
jgi:hypothetical protein